MNAETPSSPAVPADSWLRRFRREWDEFWFRPADPTRLGLVRIGAGLVVLVTFLSYSFVLQEFLGKDAWLDPETRLREVRDRPNDLMPFSGSARKAPPPCSPAEERYFQEYVEKFQEEPPGPYPRNDKENEYCLEFRKYWEVDLRKYGMPIPQFDDGMPSQQTLDEDSYLQGFAYRHKLRFGTADAPAPPYPRTAAEKQEIFDYLEKYGKDLHRLASRGDPVWSLWFYVTDPAAMQLLHAVVLGVAVLFTLGCCTKITAPLTWFFNLNYLFRTPYTVFGADGIINILLLYLMIGPCGAALSVDRLIARWWSRNKLAVVNGWRSIWRKPALTAAELRPSAYRQPPPALIGANVVIRLLQVHLCLIYLISGLTKLGATAWWNGTAIWPILVQPELAPVQFDFYNAVLRLLARHEFLFYLFLFAGTYFTLVLEIGYPFLIWTRLRRLCLAGAVLLHVLIGFMGLPTFGLIMLVMNAAFLTDGEVHWFLGVWERGWKGRGGNSHKIRLAGLFLLQCLFWRTIILWGQVPG